MTKKVKPAVWVDSPVNKTMLAQSRKEVLEIISALDYVLYLIGHTNKPAFWNIILHRVSSFIDYWIRKIGYSPLYLGLPIEALPKATPYSDLPASYSDEDDLSF